MNGSELIGGILHLDVAYDWGDEIDLTKAALLAPSSAQELVRRPRTPVSIAFRSPPLLFPLLPISVDLIGRPRVEAALHVTVFDFGGVNVRIDLPFKGTGNEWLKVATDQAALACVIRQVRERVEPLQRVLIPAIQQPHWQEYQEEYLVFHFDPATLPPPDRLFSESAAWLAGLLRQEAGSLSDEEVGEALRQKLSYTPQDLVVVDWAGAVVVDMDCEETLRTIEFANLQLLEFRHLDQRLDASLEQVYSLVHSPSRLPTNRLHSPGKSLRALGDLRIESEVMFERAANAFQLVGDQYLARLYRLLASRLHLHEWGQSIRQSLDVAEGVYQILADQISARRIELMELVVIVLIAVEILLSLVDHLR